MTKPILFNADMVRAILEGRKTVTRRVVKRPYYIDEDVLLPESGLCMHFGTNKSYGMPYPDRLYHPGEILYVRETFCRQHSVKYPFVYKASVETPAAWSWKPSIHMPREAARIFLRVTDVRVERLQDITEEHAQREGLYPGWTYTEKSSPAMTARQAFMWVWDMTIKPADRALYGWAADPWVWVIEFERISREEALSNE